MMKDTSNSHSLSRDSAGAINPSRGKREGKRGKNGMKKQEMRQRLYIIFEAELECCSGLVKPRPAGGELKWT